MAEVSRIRLFPVKALDGVDVDSVSICGNGRIQHDRTYAMFDEDGEYVNARQNARVHRLGADIDIEAGTVTLRKNDGDGRFRCEIEAFADDPEVEAWLSEFFGEPVTVREASKSNFTDSAGGIVPYRISATGPTVVSTASLEAVASWYEDLTVEDIRRRLRTNIEISGVEPFWEDRLFTDADHAVEFRIGDTTLHGMMSKPRCVTPTRDPDSGDLKEGFTSRFVEKREQTFPEWADPDHLGHHIAADVEHYYYLTVVTRIPGAEVGERLTVGDDVSIEGELPLLETL